MSAATPFLASSDAENFRLKLGQLWSKFTFTGHASAASASARSVNPAFKVFTEDAIDDGAEASVDSGATFGTLDTAADPAVVGFIGLVGDAAEVYTIESHLVIAGSASAAPYTLCGVSSSGVTLSKNLALTASLTGLDMVDAGAEAQTLTLHAYYRKV
jgi:hypothetical protein